MDRVLEVGLEIEELSDIALEIESDKNLNLYVGEQAAVPTSYNALMDKPSIESVVLQGNKTFAQLGLQEMTEQDIDDMIYGG